MSHSSHGAPTAPGRRRPVGEPYRPIADSLRLPTAHVATIDDSHSRCAAQGLSRFKSPDLSPMARSDFTVLRERNNRLFERAAPVMEMLFEQIVYTQSMVVLCDATGTVLHSVGDDEFLAQASKVALAPGVNWSESAKGTNAIGTALISEVPTLVHADEHFMHANHFLTCSAAPILDPRGNMLGVLDVTGDHRSYHQHTMALVKMSARMIENHWLADDYRHVMRLHFHGRVEFIGTLKEGILAVTAEGRIVGANRSALDQLGLSGASLRMQSVESLMGVSVGALVEHFRSPLAKPFAAHVASGQAVHLLARFDWPVWHTIAEAASGAANATVTASKHAEPASMAGPTMAPWPTQGGALAPDAPAQGAASTDANKGVANPTSLAEHPSWLTTEDLRCGDASMALAIDKSLAIADAGIPLLLVGEMGVGKATLARALHGASRRGAKPFVVVHGATLPRAQQVDVLFAEPTSARPGMVYQALGGTLFLDAVDELSPDAQLQLLRWLQEPRSMGLASPSGVAEDTVLVGATRIDLREAVQAGRFREDLYYRLNGLTVKVPALRHRSDVVALAERVVARVTQGRRAMRLSDEVQRCLRACAWPGNVRQLVNGLRSACMVARDETVLLRSHLPDDLGEEGQALTVPSGLAASAARSLRGADLDLREGATAHASLDMIEVEAIRNTVQACGGNISEASKRLGISRNTIYRKLRWASPREAPSS